MTAGIEKVLRLARDAIAPALRASDEPLTFWLGAGASMSSGAPSSGQVCTAIDERAAGRGPAPSGAITAAFNGWTPDERIGAVEPLFRGFVPYLGYRLLAGLGRHRPVKVVNLNWDRGPEMACDLLGVPCRSFDLADLGSHPEYGAWSADRTPGIVVAHVHGLLDGDGDNSGHDIRYSTEQTLRLEEAAFDLLSAEYLAHVTVVVGASLEGDTDVSDLLRRLGEPVERPRPAFLFGRDANTPDSHALGWLRARMSDRNTVFDPAVDFDRIMLHLAEGFAGYGFEDLPTDFGGLKLPRPDRLIMPRSGQLRGLLDEPVITLVGQPEAGKTTTAVLVGHVAALCSGQTGTSPLRLPVATADAIAALADPPTTPMVIDDPFGSSEDDFRDYPTLRDALVSVPPVAGWHPVIVATRRSVWVRALTDTATPTDDGVLSADADLFSGHELDLLTKPSENEVRARIEAGDITTPWQLHRSRRGLPNSGDAKHDTLAVLHQQPGVALLATLTRLQAFSDDPRPLGELVAIVGNQGHDSSAVRHDADWLLHTFELDSKTYARLESSAAEAVDDLLSDPASATSLSLAAVAPTTAWVAEARAVHAVFRTDPSGVVAAAASLRAQQLTEWLPSLYDAFPKVADLVSEDRLRGLDAWGSCELALNTLVQWINSSPISNRLLAGLFDNVPVNGVYALVEGACYLNSRTPAKPRDKIVAALWDLLDDSNIGEALRCYDALLWLPHAIGDLGVSDEWIRNLVTAAEAEDTASGALLAVHAYHGHSQKLLRRLDLGDRLASQMRMTADEARGAIEMVRWHFEHQARNTAIMLRHRMVDLNSLGRIGTRSANGTAVRPAHLLDALLQHSIGTGWVAVAGLNLMSTVPAGDFTDAVNKALEAASADDPGLTSALIGYTIPDDCISVARSRFREIKNQAMEALTQGISTRSADSVDFGWASDGVVAPPRFKLVRDPHRHMSRLGYRSRGLESVNIIMPGNADEFLTELHHHRAELLTRYPLDIVDSVLARVDAGDVRAFDVAANARFRTTRNTTMSPTRQLFEIILEEQAAAAQQQREDTPETLALDLGRP